MFYKHQDSEASLECMSFIPPYRNTLCIRLIESVMLSFQRGNLVAAARLVQLSSLRSEDQHFLEELQDFPSWADIQRLKIKQVKGKHVYILLHAILFKPPYSYLPLAFEKR